MNPTFKKLVLSRETIRALDDTDLRRLRGGFECHLIGRTPERATEVAGMQLISTPDTNCITPHETLHHYILP